MSLKDAVLKFLSDTNRPYSLNEILEKCGKDNGKSSVQKVLDSLTAKDKVIEKTFGKQKIYFIKQDENSSKENASQYAALEKKLIQLRSEVKTKEEKLQKIEAELKKLEKIPSFSDLETERNELKNKIENYTDVLKDIQNSSNVSPSKKLSLDQIKNIEKNYEKFSSAYRKRKRICNNMIDAIMEGYPKAKKQLIEDIGLETDESVGFKI